MPLIAIVRLRMMRWMNVSAWRIGRLMGTLACASVLGSGAVKAAEPLFESELIFPAEHWHNHASCVVQLPNKDLLVCWYHGSGERRADDVIIEGARKKPGAERWSERFLLADTAGYPDTNPAMIVDPQGRLWLLWPTILDNRWESALLKYRISTNYHGPGAPAWSEGDVLHVTPGDRFAGAVTAFAQDAEKLVGATTPVPHDMAQYLGGLREAAQNKLTRRLGWMPRVHPFIVDNRRMIVPLYSDGFNFSLMVYTDDWGRTWQTSDPLPGLGNVQPSIVRRRNGALYTLMRDNGPPPQRLLQSESFDLGRTWTPVTDSDIPNPGSGAEIITLRTGEWVLINNDTDEGRHQLVVQVSDDEGKTWKWRRYLEKDSPGPSAGSYSYPSLIEASDGFLHATYSHHLSRRASQDEGAGGRKSIKHARFNLDWVRAGDN